MIAPACPGELEQGQVSALLVLCKPRIVNVGMQIIYLFIIF